MTYRRFRESSTPGINLLISTYWWRNHLSRLSVIARHFRDSCHFARFRCNTKFRGRCRDVWFRQMSGHRYGQVVGRSSTGLRKSHTHKLRLTLLSGARGSGTRGTPRLGNEWGHLTGLIYVQFSNRTRRYAQPNIGREETQWDRRER